MGVADNVLFHDMGNKIITFDGKTPKLGEKVFIADGAFVIGDVEIGDESSVWFNAVVRGDVNYIRIGSRTNIQDCAACHCTRRVYPLFIGSEVTVGHSAVLHACKIRDGCLIGMGAVVLDNAEVGEESIIAAGSVVPPGAVIPPRTLAVGSPAKPRRPVTDDELEYNKEGMLNYLQLAESYMVR